MTDTIKGTEALQALINGKKLVLADKKILLITVSNEDIGLQLSAEDFNHTNFKILDN